MYFPYQLPSSIKQNNICAIDAPATLRSAMTEHVSTVNPSVLAFAMASHARLGSASPFRMLPPDITQCIMKKATRRVLWPCWATCTTVGACR